MDFLEKEKNFSKQPRHWRINILVFFVLFVATLILVRLGSVQILAHEKYVDIAENQHKIFKELNPQRGEIFLDDDGGTYPLAVNREMQMVYAIPRNIEDQERFIRELSSILNIKEGEVREKISDSKSAFKILKRKLTDDEVRKIESLDLKGIGLVPENFRYYPSGELASHVVGFVGSDGEKLRGMYGLESFLNEKLSGAPGSLSQEKDAAGRWISIIDRELQPAKDGVDVVLTINHTIQYETERILKEAVDEYKAERGTVVVVEPSTGKILALANYPNFNPNEYSKVEDMSLFLNPAVSFAYESGSVFKTITMAAGIDDGKVSPDTTYVDNGFVKEAGYTIKNSEEKVYGKQTMTQALEESLNTGMIFVEKLLGNQKFADYVKRFGFGEKTNIDLPGEISGNIRNLEYLKRDINFFTASFGQGVSVTPIQLVSAYGAVANEGVLMKPQIIDRFILPDGEVEKVNPEEVRRVISREAAREVGRMLRSVVVNGHGKRADVPGYLVGGKTGTAQVASSDKRGYDENSTIGSFAGFAPIDDPKFAILVKINKPQGVQWAESTAAPVFGKVMKLLLEHYRIKPTEEVELGG